MAKLGVSSLHAIMRARLGVRRASIPDVCRRMGIKIDFWTPWGQAALLPPTVPESAVLGIFALTFAALLVHASHDFARLTWRRLGLLVILVGAPLVLTNLFAPRYPTLGLLPPPGMPLEQAGAFAPILAALPIGVAAAWLGAGPAMLVGLATGAAHALLTPVTILDPFYFVLYGFLAARLLRQRQWGHPSTVLRQPLVAVPASCALALPLLLVAAFTRVWASGLAGLDYAATLVGARAGPLMLQAAATGILLQVAFLALPAARRATSARGVQPQAQSLFRRQVSLYVPLIVLMVSIFIVVATRTALRVSEDTAVDEMSRDAHSAAAQVPFFLHTGQSLLASFSDARLLDDDSADTRDEELQRNLRTVAFFDQLILVDGDGQPLSAYPATQTGDLALTTPESVLVRQALSAGASQVSDVHRSGSGSAIVSFVVPIDASGEGGVVGPIGALIGRTRVDVNPVLDQALAALEWTHDRGEAFIVDADDQIVIHRDAELLLTEWRIVERPAGSERDAEGWSYESRSPRDGTRQLVYSLPVSGHPWSVVVLLPYEVVLGKATAVAVPLLLVQLGLGVGLVMIAFVATRALARPLAQLAEDADRIAAGGLTRPVAVRSDDEVGAVARALDRLRIRLKGRLDDLSLLLEISRAVSATVDVEEGLSHILEGGLRTSQAQVARVVVVSANGEITDAVGKGEIRHGVRELDRALVLAVGESDAPVVFAGEQELSELVSREGTGAGRIRSVVAVPVRSAGALTAVVWVGHRDAQGLEGANLDTLSTLAGQTAVLIENARLFRAAEGERRTLAAILNSATDAILVTARDGRLVLCNPSAQEALGVVAEGVVGERIDDLDLDEGLLNLLRQPLYAGQMLNSEVVLAGGRTFSCSVAVIVGEAGEQFGRVATMRDITVLRDLARSRSQFVERVSHDLRRPLTLIRGYAMMLPMVGPLGDRQQEFVASIVESVEQTGELVQDLLSLGGLEAGDHEDRRPVLLSSVVLDVVRANRARAEKGGVFLRAGSLDATAVIIGDAARLHQAVAILIDTAIGGARAGDPVRVDLNRTGDSATIVVWAGSAGAEPDATLDHSQRAGVDTSDDDADRAGGGLEMATVRSIVEQHGGSLRIDDQPEVGIGFTLTLPATGDEPPG